MAKTSDQKYFIPAWVLEDKDLSAGDKLVLCVLCTRSTQIDESGNRASYRIGAGAISDLLGYSYLQVTKILKKLEGNMIKKIDGGFLLISPDAPATPAEEATEEPATTTTTTTTTDVAPQAPEAYQPRNLLQGCYTWEECVTCLTGKSICVSDLVHSYESTLDSAPFKSNLFRYLQACRERVKKNGGKDTDLFVAEKKKS